MDSNNRNENNENVDEYFDYLPADHPLYKKMQGAIEDQLKKEEESLRLMHKEKSEELKKVKRTREDIGINLYGYQQQYAKLEEFFSEIYEKYKLLKAQREETENHLSEEAKNYNDKNQAVKEQQKMVLQATEELNQLNSMLKYVETYNLQVDSEIKVTNTTAYVVEKKIRENEREKKEQDFFIDYLEEQIKTLTEKKLLYEAQLKSQKEETSDARANLNEAQKEIENILERKRNLIKDWDKSLISMKTRDKALQVVRDNIAEQEGEKLKYNSQINRYSELIESEIHTNEGLKFEIRKILMKQEVVDKSIQDITTKRSRQEEKRMFLKTSIMRTKDELHTLEIREQQLQSGIELIEKNKLKLLDEARALNDKNLIVLSSKETHEKQTENLIKLNNKLNKDIFEIQVEIDAKQNEIARVEIDKLNVETQNDALKKKLKLMDNEITKLESMYSNKESEIKKNHEDLEKKQLNVDKLNKKFGELTKNKGGEDEGLFEVKIKELQSELSNLSKEIQEAEQEWIVKKTNLVSKANVLNNIEEECVDKRSKKMILEHKKLRLNKNYEMHEKEIREVEISLKNLRYDMNKYNGQLGKNVSHKEKLEREFFDDEIEFREKLKQMENEAVRLELEIEVIREEKADTLTQIMEVERQINLWDRKITLEEKMQEIIKPDKGIKEIEEMKSLIHRQDLLYIKLKQEQEKVIKSMETAIQRRDFIKLRYPIEKNGYSSGYASKDGNGKQSTKSPIQSTTGNQKELNDLKEHVKRVLSRKNNIIQDLEQNRRIMDDVRQNIENVEYQQRELQSKAMIYQNEYFKNKLKSNSLFCKTLQNQEAAKILDENRPKPRKREEMAKALEEHRSQTELMEGILKNFKDTHPEWDEIVSKALEF
jgi:chromosome segregation ATPase